MMNFQSQKNNMPPVELTNQNLTICTKIATIKLEGYEKYSTLENLAKGGCMMKLLFSLLCRRFFPWKGSSLVRGGETP